MREKEKTKKVKREEKGTEIVYRESKIEDVTTNGRVP